MFRIKVMSSLRKLRDRHLWPWRQFHHMQLALIEAHERTDWLEQFH